MQIYLHMSGFERIFYVFRRKTRKSPADVFGESWRVHYLGSLIVETISREVVFCFNDTLLLLIDYQRRILDQLLLMSKEFLTVTSKPVDNSGDSVYKRHVFRDTKGHLVFYMSFIMSLICLLFRHVILIHDV